MQPADPSTHLRLMTLNVRRRLPRFATRRVDRWERRLPLFHRLVEAERPHLLGLQEVMPGQSDDIRAALGDRYASAGTGRDSDGGGERCELHVDTDRLRIRSSRRWWLSSTPDVPGSRDALALWPRVVLDVEVETVPQDPAAAARLRVLVTHLDPILEASRRSATRALAHRAAELDGPVVVMGDFNSDAGSAPHRLATGSGLVDALDAATLRSDPGWGTFSNHAPPRPGGKRLDWILVDGSAVVERAGVLAPRWDGAAVSDHEPVVASVRWP